MNIEIEIADNCVYVSDEEIKYMLFNMKPYLIYYENSKVHIPFVSSIAESSDDIRSTILDNHEEIKRYLYNLRDICNKLPDLVLCKLPERDDYGIHNNITLNNGDRICRNGICTDYYPVEGGYVLRIYVKWIRKGITLSKTIEKGNGKTSNINYFIENKVIETEQEFDAELFAESIRNYINDHLSILLNLYTTNNTKSAKVRS